jgi:2,4-dienoyl-CoA reductase (NADPH2)
VTLYEQADRIGGQLNMAVRIPGKEEFAETLRYFRHQLELLGVPVHLKTTATAALLAKGAFDEIVLATGVMPRRLEIEGADHPCVLDYSEVLLGLQPGGRRVAVIGAGGIHSPQDARDFIEQGARAVQLDSVIWVRPHIAEVIARDLGGLELTRAANAYPDEWYPGIGLTDVQSMTPPPPKDLPE